MAYWLSEPIETLIEQPAYPGSERQRAEQAGAAPNLPKDGKPLIPECEVLVVGSGYGGAVAAMRLAGANRPPNAPVTVIVLERGKEYALGDFPENLGEAPGHIRLQRPDSDKPLGNSEALFDFRVGEHIAALVANGLGGGSLINANVAIEPDHEVLDRPEWPAKLREPEQRKALLKSMRGIEELLGVATNPETPGKMKALERLVGALNKKLEAVPGARKASCNPAPIAVTFAGGRNAVGIHQEPCVRCGNCVTGCNVGAKNTLAMNLLPLAKARGARLYTGATVLSVKPEPPIRGQPPSWLVRYRRTATEKGPLHDEIHTIRARTVVLAAGTFGSTEILLRSQALGDLDCSKRLGEGFSGNGDALIFGYGQRTPVGCIASGGSLAGLDSTVGPTISGVARVQLNETGKNAARRMERRVPGPWPRFATLEDGAVPIILKRVFAEIVTAGSLIKRHTKDSIPAWCESHKEADPLGIHDDALTHSQLLLGMGDDGAPGKLVLVPAAEGGWDDARVTVQWRTEGANLARAFQRSLDAAFLDSEDGGFDGGDYIANPIALPLPEDFDGALTGGIPPGMQVTVHPLGGCPMGADSRSGVVNEYGQVWRRRGNRNQRFYDGLYVLDGSIIPVALGVNPFLTIAALADLSASEILRTSKEKWVESELRNAPLPPVPQTRRSVPVVKEPVRGKFKERLTGRLDTVPSKWLGLDAASPNDLAAEIEITIDDMDDLLRDPGRKWSAKCVLRVPQAGDEKKPVKGHGTVQFFARNGPPNQNEARARAWGAISAFLQRRKPYLPDTDQSTIEQAKGFWRVAKNHGHWRSMVYRFTFGNGEDEWVLKGTKELAYESGRANVWTALTQLPVTAVLRKHEGKAARNDEHHGMLEVDLAELTRHAPLQVTASPNLPETLMTMVGAGMLFLRTLFQTHFWSFPAPDYAEIAPTVVRDPGELKVASQEEHTGKAPEGHVSPGGLRVSGHRKIAPETIALAVSNAKDSVQIRLIRYANPGKQKVLLIHGLAHGACIFTTNTVTTPLAAYLYDRGLEPWLLEHRLSHALPGTAARPSNMDDLASGDIKTAVDYVYRQNGNEPIAVFAHCIGAGAFSMAVLGGHCHDAKGERAKSKIKAAAIHAVPPWVVPSRANRMRANLAAFLKDVIGVGVLDPIPSTKDRIRWHETIIDRIAASLPAASQSDGRHHLIDTEKSGMSKDICNRMTLFYGREWVHENLDPGTHRELAGLFGVGNLEVFRHVFFLAQRGRITDREGRNEYLTSDRISRFWSFPTLFAHGTENKVFDIQSSRRSSVRLRNLQENLRAEDPGRYKDQDRSVFIQQVRGYGHMDYIFGREAHIAVYPMLGDFLSEKDNKCSALVCPSADLDPVEPDDHPPCGPLVGDAQRDPSDSGAVRLRIWLELNKDVFLPVGRSTFKPTFILLAADDTVVGRITNAEVAEEPAQYGTYVACDVVVPTTTGRKLVVGFSNKLSLSAEKEVRTEPIDLTLPWFRRLSEGRAVGCSFLVGSCRHPGSPFERELCDKVMHAMLGHVKDGGEEKTGAKRQGVDHVLFVGDQIYADATADAFDTNEPGERFAARYRELFQSQGFKELARSVPIRMAIDDHEISNNWPGRNRPNAPAPRNPTSAGAPAQHNPSSTSAPPQADATSANASAQQNATSAVEQSSRLEMLNERGDQRLLEELEIARESAFCYEILAAPGTRGPDKELWYQFESGGLQFFVLDCRTQRVQRQRDIRPVQASMFGESHEDAQCKALEEWLRVHGGSDRPKFIVSSTPIAPLLTDHVHNTSLWRNADNWFGYPASLDWLAGLITGRKPKNLVFLSGDYHFSATAQLWFFDSQRREASAYQVVSSGLYAPMPFANERFEDYSWDWWEAAPIAGTESVLGFKASRLSNAQSHFLRIDVTESNKYWHVDVTAIGADGEKIKQERLF